MEKVDLHIHSKYSDGSYEVKELLKMAEEKELSIISITDHDKIGAYEELKTINISEYYNGNIITGCECKCVYEKVPIEILGYGFDLQAFSNTYITQQKNLNKVQEKYLEYFKQVGKQIGLIFDSELTLTNNIIYAADCFERELKKNPENLRILKENNIDIQANFYRDCQSNHNTIFYIDETKDFSKPEEIIQAIHQSGGLAFLAHPFIYPFEDKKKTIEQIIKSYDLDGLECYYTLFTEEEKQWIAKLCDNYGKYKSGGSDFHGISKPDIQIGTGRGDLIVLKKDVEEWINLLHFFYKTVEQ